MRVGAVGSSARAAVHSLTRAGFLAWAVDQFADRDLTRVAPSALCPPDRYPDAIPELAARFPPGPVLYTGGLENHPHIIRQLASRRTLWGIPPEVLERVRDPFTLFPALAEAGFATPRLIPPGQPCPAGGRWVRKPIRSGGGLGIRFAQPGEAPSSLHAFEEYLEGTPMSAHFISDPAGLNGVTEQLIGEPWLHASPFAYCGNIGPIEVPQHLATGLWRSGLKLNRTMALRGLWGLDFVSVGDVVHPVEVNPRYTAAVEVLELARRCSFLLAHARCFTDAPALAQDQSGQHREAAVGKAVYYAPHTITFPQTGPWDADLAGEFDPWRVPRFADIPEAGGAIGTGSPVLTFFAVGSTPVEVRRRLQSRAAELDVLFEGCKP